MFWIVPDGHAHTIKFPQQSSCGICTKPANPGLENSKKIICRKVTKRPTKLQGCRVVRALFTDCASLSKFCGAEKLFVRISKGRVRFAAPWGRFTISFGETQFQQYSALFYGNGWKPLFCNIDTTQGPSNIVGYTGVKVVMGFILETVWCSGNKFFKILLPCATGRLETVLPGLRVKGTVGSLQHIPKLAKYPQL